MRRLNANSRLSLKSESGALSLDFLFSFTLVFAFTLILFALCFTLSVVEITQYVTFAVARNYAAGHENQEAQRNIAVQKYEQLRNNTPAIRGLYANGWFLLSNPEVGPNADRAFLSEYSPSGDDRDTFVGARVTLNAKVLELRIPFFGNTFDQEDGFVTRISSFVGREPTTDECKAFNNQRMGALIQLNGKYQQHQGAAQQDYALITDNGC
jgi:hypothetical protein